MKIYHLIVIAGIALVASSCRQNAYQGQVVKETYIHKYGVPVPKADWEKQGKDGQIVQLCKDGVSISRSYEDGMLHGKTTFSFPNSSTIQKVQLFDRAALISEVENYPSGIPLQEKRYEADHLTKITAWYEDGTPSLIETYSEGLLTYGEYRTPLNVIEAKVENGRGIRTRRGQEGELCFKDNIQNGEMVERICYYANGDPSDVIPYENGLIHGQRLTFSLGGLPRTVEQWVHGKQEGTSVSYQNGEKVAEAPYVNGKKHGIEKQFHDGTKVVAEISWKNGLQHGPSQIIADGGAAKTEWYHYGELVSKHTYDRMNLR